MTAGRCCLVLMACLWAGFSPPVQGQARVQGTVVAAGSGAPLPSAHVQAEGTPLGTITNVEGRFTLEVPRLPATLLVRHLGYELVRLTVTDAAPVEIRMPPTVVPLGEVLVAGEDLGAGIMRRVIARKRQRRAGLRTYAAEAYTRLLLSNEGAPRLLGEAVFDAYWDRERGPRDVVRARRRTAALPAALPFVETGPVPDLSADLIPLAGLDLIGPTHPDALTYYSFRVAGRRMLGDRLVYDLFVSPRDEREATFIGTLSVLDEADALLQAELRPARHVRFPPPIAAWRIGYAQQFAVAGDSLWMPIDLRAEGVLVYAPDVQTEQRIGFEQVARMTAYRLNVPLPAAAYASDARVVVDTAAVFSDPLFLTGRSTIPLTAREVEALERLRDRPFSLRTAFPPARRTGLLARLLDPDAPVPRLTWPTLYGYVFRFHYDRVDGLYSSVGVTMPLSARLTLEARLGQGTGRSAVRHLARLRYAPSARLYVEARSIAGTTPRQQGSRHARALTSLQARTGGGDYFDYLWLRGGALEAGYAAGRLSTSLGLLYERHQSAEREVRRPWPFETPFPSNPEVDPGTLVGFALRLGLAPAPPSRKAGIGPVQVDADHTPGASLGSDFRFTRLHLTAAAQTPTFLRRRPSPARMTVQLTAGRLWGRPPIQGHGVLDAGLRLFDTLPLTRAAAFRTAQGRPFEGTAYAALFWQHDFTTAPFELLRLWPLVHRRMGLSVFGAHGHAWFAGRTTPPGLVSHPMDRPRHELGLSLTRFAGTPLRLDAAWRLDAPAFTLGLGFVLDRR